MKTQARVALRWRLAACAKVRQRQRNGTKVDGDAVESAEKVGTSYECGWSGELGLELD